ELDQRYADDPKQAANVQTYLAELGQGDFPASETGFAPTLPASVPADYRVAGSASCVSCHESDGRTCADSKHGHAWETLANKGYQVDAFCQKCHTTGYGWPGGFESVARTPLAQSVQCESCHGPSLGHTGEIKIRTPFAAKDQCVRCHDRENSPSFAYDG